MGNTEQQLFSQVCQHNNEIMPDKNIRYTNNARNYKIPEYFLNTPRNYYLIV